ncbi:MAG: F0F1 ATP synthase subunit A, partial [Gemmatimonadaceae bacterium]
KHALGPADLIMPHITDSKTVELPCFNKEWECDWHLPSWPVNIGNTTIDLGPTKFVFFMVVAAGLCLLTLVGAARSHARATREHGHPTGFAAGMESVVLLLRGVFKEALGEHGAAYIPFVLTLFFFILFMNLMGLLPYGSTPTGNLGVNATLAACAFIATETAGMIALGPAGYMKTIVYWPSDLGIAIKLPLSVLIMTPVEIIGKFTKPFALTVRLFANMIAGHVIVLTMIGLALLFGSWAIAFLGPIPMALGIMLLEVLVSFIQAFIFALLTAVFIGQIRTAHH